MIRASVAAALFALLPLAALGQEAIGTLTLTSEDGERPFVVIQGAEGPNPGSRYSRLGGDVVFNLVAVGGDRPVNPKDADETVELRFTVSEDGPEVRSGSVLSYSTKGAEGTPSTRGGTVEVAVDSLETNDDRVSTSGTFTAQLPPDDMSEVTEVEGTFQTAMKSREALNP